MKRKISVVLLITLLVSMLVLTPAYAAEQQITIYIDNSPVAFDVAPVVENGRTLVPMRAIFEAFNTNVEWDNATQTVTASTEYLMCLELQIGNLIAKKYFLSPSDDYNFETNTGTFTKDQLQEIKLDVPAKLIDGRTMVPLRFIAESMNYDVKWDGANNRVNILTGNEDLTTPPDKTDSSSFDTSDIRNSLPLKALSEETKYKKTCFADSISYFDAVNNSDHYSGTYQTFFGEVAAVENRDILLNTNQGIVRVGLPDGAVNNILVGRRVTAYGQLGNTSIYTGQDMFGFPKTFSCPYLKAAYIDGQWNQAQFENQKSDIGAEIQELYARWYDSTIFGGSDYDDSKYTSMDVSNDLFDGFSYVILSGEKQRDAYGEEYLKLQIQTTWNLSDEAVIGDHDVSLYYLRNKLVVDGDYYLKK